MPGKKNDSIKKLLEEVKSAITNTLATEDVSLPMREFGYDETELNVGREVLLDAEAKVFTQSLKAGLAKDATAEQKRKSKTAHKAYQDLAKAARAVFVKDDATLTKLGLDSPMPRLELDFINAAKMLFTNVLADSVVQNKLEHRSYTPGKLTTELAKITDYETKNEDQGKASGFAQDATRDQDEALKKLKEWYMEFRKIARVALSKRPEMLETIGIKARSSKTKKQREAPKKAAATRAKKKLPK